MRPETRRWSVPDQSPGLRETITVLREGVRQDLDGDVAIQLGIGGAIDCAHAALAQLGSDAVVGDGELGRHFFTAACQLTRTLSRPGSLSRPNGIKKRLPSGLISKLERLTICGANNSLGVLCSNPAPPRI